MEHLSGMISFSSHLPQDLVRFTLTERSQAVSAKVLSRPELRNRRRLRAPVAASSADQRLALEAVGASRSVGPLGSSDLRLVDGRCRHRRGFGESSTQSPERRKTPFLPYLDRWIRKRRRSPKTQGHWIFISWTTVFSLFSGIQGWTMWPRSMGPAAMTQQF